MGRIEVSPDFVRQWGDELARQRWDKEFQYPQTPEERQAIEDRIKREYERCKESYDYWYRNYYKRLND